MIRATLALGLLFGSVACQIDMPMRDADTAPVLSPRIAVSAELADVAVEAASNWEAAAPAFAPALTVADRADADAADWTVVFVDHVDPSCMTDTDPNPRGCTLGGPTQMRIRRGPFVFEGTTESAHKVIQIRRSVDAYEVVSTIMHEYGHALGLEHLPEGLMNPNRGRNERINPLVDAATLTKLGALTQPNQP